MCFRTSQINARDSPCVIWGKNSQYSQHCFLCFPGFPVPSFPPGATARAGEPSTDHTGKLTFPSSSPQTFGKTFSSRNRAGEDVGEQGAFHRCWQCWRGPGLPELCSCALGWERHRHFPPFTSPWGFLPSAHSGSDPAPPSAPPGNGGFAGTSGATATPQSPVQLSLSPSCPCPQGHPACAGDPGGFSVLG